MKPLLVALMILLASCIIGSAAQQLATAMMEPSAADIAADYAQAERHRLDAELYAEWQPRTTAVISIALYLAIVGVLAYLGALGVLSWQRIALERRPDSRGLLPVAASDQATARAALASFHAARIEEARRPQVPTSPAQLTYAPHYAPHITHQLEYEGGTVNGVAALPAPAGAGGASATPSFRSFLDAGRIGRGHPLLLGINRATGAPIEGSWEDLYSCAVGGLSGSGKTWTMAFLAAQAALHGARIVLLDPHADNAESLASRLAPLAPRFICDVADRPHTMRQAVDLVAGELERRRNGGRGEPWLFLADEFSALQRGQLADPLADLVEGLGQEGRKMGLFGMIGGQVWSGTRAGGSELRDSLASAYVHRLRPAQARMLTGLTAEDLPADLLELPKGAAYLLTTAGNWLPVGIPVMDTRDIERVAELADCMPDGSQTEAKPESGSRSSVRAEAALALQMFRRGLDLPQIVKELRGVDSSTGRKYQEAAREVQQLLREALV